MENTSCTRATPSHAEICSAIIVLWYIFYNASRDVSGKRAVYAHDKDILRRLIGVSKWVSKDSEAKEVIMGEVDNNCTPMGSIVDRRVEVGTNVLARRKEIRTRETGIRPPLKNLNNRRVRLYQLENNGK